jgi:hypothetical protein
MPRRTSRRAFGRWSPPSSGPTRIYSPIERLATTHLPIQGDYLLLRPIRLNRQGRRPIDSALHPRRSRLTRRVGSPRSLRGNSHRIAQELGRQVGPIRPDGRVKPRIDLKLPEYRGTARRFEDGAATPAPQPRAATRRTGCRALPERDANFRDTAPGSLRGTKYSTG